MGAPVMDRWTIVAAAATGAVIGLLSPFGGAALIAMAFAVFVALVVIGRALGRLWGQRFRGRLANLLVRLADRLSGPRTP